MNVSFGWWNTSLSPLGKPRATEAQKATALEIVQYLIVELGVDCLALGEVISDDLLYFKHQLELGYFELYDGTRKEGRLQFDIGVFCRKATFQIIDHKPLIVERGGRSFKLANKLDLRIKDDGTFLHLFVSHWPSRLRCEQNGVDRQLLGVRLRDEIKELSVNYDGDVYAILMGDYNDEPFGASLEGQLQASRDRRLVRKQKELLYNPFWRHLGETIPHVPVTPCQSIGGSYYHSKGEITRWRTFDQIIFSSAFLRKSDWQLNEEYTKIVQIEPYDDLVRSAKEIFDHFPVLSVI